MQAHSELLPRADPEAWVAFVIAVNQGGILVGKTGRDAEPLRNMHVQVLDHLRSFLLQTPER